MFFRYILQCSCMLMLLSTNALSVSSDSDQEIIDHLDQGSDLMRLQKTSDQANQSFIQAEIDTTKATESATDGILDDLQKKRCEVLKAHRDFKEAHEAYVEPVQDSEGYSCDPDKRSRKLRGIERILLSTFSAVIDRYSINARENLSPENAHDAAQDFALLVEDILNDQVSLEPRQHCQQVTDFYMRMLNHPFYNTLEVQFYLSELPPTLKESLAEAGYPVILDQEPDPDSHVISNLTSLAGHFYRLHLNEQT